MPLFTTEMAYGILFPIVVFTFIVAFIIAFVIVALVVALRVFAFVVWGTMDHAQVHFVTIICTARLTTLRGK